MSDAFARGERLALVTGTSRGLGRAIAAALLERGWRVLGLARGAAPDELAAKPRYRHERVDLADLAAIVPAVERALPPALGLGGARSLALVNNAGVVEPVAPVARLAPDAIARALLVDAAAPLVLSGWALRQERVERLRIVDLSSGAARSPYAGWAAYCAGKAALEIAGKVVALEAGDRAGRDTAVVSYAPGVVDTDMQARIRAHPETDFPSRARFVALHAQGELVAPEGPAAEIAELCGSDGLPAWSERRFRG